MAAFCDLHTHSAYSDGTFSPAELLREAEKANLAAVALCDHNTVGGLPDFLASAAGREVEAIPGVEEAIPSHEKNEAIVRLSAEVSDAVLKETVEKEGYRVLE